MFIHVCWAYSGVGRSATMCLVNNGTWSRPPPPVVTWIPIHRVSYGLCRCMMIRPMWCWSLFCSATPTQLQVRLGLYRRFQRGGWTVPTHLCHDPAGHPVFWKSSMDGWYCVQYVADVSSVYSAYEGFGGLVTILQIGAVNLIPVCRVWTLLILLDQVWCADLMCFAVYTRWCDVAIVSSWSVWFH
jgi:hypothetical protein